MPEPRPPVLEVTGLKKHFPIKKGLLRRTAGYVYAVDGVTLSIRAGETLGLAELRDVGAVDRDAAGGRLDQP